MSTIIGGFAENAYSLPRSKTQVKAVPKKLEKLTVISFVQCTNGKLILLRNFVLVTA